MRRFQAIRRHTCHPYWTGDNCQACEAEAHLMTRRDYAVIAGLTLFLIAFWAGIALLLVAVSAVLG
jgi:hypothetical protein